MVMARGLRRSRTVFRAAAIRVEPVPRSLVGAGFAVVCRARFVVVCRARFVVVRPAEAAIEGEYRQRHPANI